MKNIAERERRRISELLRLRAVAGLDPGLGVQLGRSDRYSIRWEAIISLLDRGHTTNEMRLGQ